MAASQTNTEPPIAEAQFARVRDGVGLRCQWSQATGTMQNNCVNKNPAAKTEFGVLNHPTGKYATIQPGGYIVD